MAEPTESLTRLMHFATDPFSLAILAGVTSSSFYFFANVGLALIGIVPAITTKSERTRKDISDTSSLNMWAWMYNRAKVRPPTTLPPLTRAEPVLSPCVLFRRYILC